MSHVCMSSFLLKSLPCLFHPFINTILFQLNLFISFSYTYIIFIIMPYIRRVCNKNCNFAPISFYPTVCLSALKPDSRTCERILIKSDTGSFNHVCRQNPILVTIAHKQSVLHTNLCVFLHSTGVSCAIRKREKSYFGKRGIIFTLCTHFLSCLLCFSPP
jgi:hypothetical protein